MTITGFLPKRNPDDKIITIAGNIGADPELKYSQKGLAYIRLRVATTAGKGDDRETQWFSVTAFGQQAENAAELSKGDRVIVRGVYEEQPGEKGVFYNVIANEIGVSILWKPAHTEKIDRTGHAMRRGAAKKAHAASPDFEEEPF